MSASILYSFSTSFDYHCHALAHGINCFIGVGDTEIPKRLLHLV